MPNNSEDYLRRLASALERIDEKLDKLVQQGENKVATPTSIFNFAQAETEDFAEQPLLCLNDDPRIREKASPCIRLAGHSGPHLDSENGTWEG